MADEQLLEAHVDLLESRLAELEGQLEEQQWERLGAGAGERELSRAALREINGWARVMYIKNPLIRRGVSVQALYVFGQGVQISGHNAAVNAVVQAFLDDTKNQAELTGHQARELKETDLSLFGNLFFVFFVNRSTGRVQVRSINEDEVAEIICNPEDAKEPWYYKRVWSEERLNLESGQTELVQRTAYYPDWLYYPVQRPVRIGPHEVRWDAPVYHAKVGGLSDMRFGVSEAYAAIDWARAYKSFLEDWATLTRAYSRFAHKMTVPGGKGNVSAAKARLATTVGMGSGETNPPPTVGSTFIAQQGVDLQPMRIGGANVTAEDGRRLMLMVASAYGLPESFFGDVSVGNLATAKSLDRPTELKMRSRQQLWAEIFRNILQFVLRWAVLAPNGALHGTVINEEDGTPRIVALDPESGEELDTTIDVNFPPILEHDVDALIRATVSAATLDGKSLAGTIDAKMVSRMLLSALGVENIDTILEELFPDPESDEPANAAAAAPVQDDGQGQVAEAIRELRTAVEQFVARLRESDDEVAG